MDGTDGPFAPCLRVAPGETINIKIENRLGDAMKYYAERTQWRKASGKRIPSPILNRTDYYEKALGSQDNPGYFANYYVTGDRLPVNLSAEQVTRLPYLLDGKDDDAADTTDLDMPGYSTGRRADGRTNGFDSTNLHLHGMEVIPHLFYPVQCAVCSSLSRNTGIHGYLLVLFCFVLGWLLFSLLLFIIVLLPLLLLLVYMFDFSRISVSIRTNRKTTRGSLRSKHTQIKPETKPKPKPKLKPKPKPKPKPKRAHHW
jgi:hypothetical protein